VTQAPQMEKERIANCPVIWSKAIKGEFKYHSPRNIRVLEIRKGSPTFHTQGFSHTPQQMWLGDHTSYTLGPEMKLHLASLGSQLYAQVTTNNITATVDCRPMVLNTSSSLCLE
jgi:hypothetical protein